MFRTMLAGGDRRSNRQVKQVLEIVNGDSRKLPELLDCLWDQDARIKMRAADALEKLSRHQAGQLQPFKDVLLQLAAESEQKEVRWHLAQIIPRLRLTNHDREQAFQLFERYLTDHSSIVKTFAMQGLADLAQNHAALHAKAIDLIQLKTKTGTPAMRARGRILLAQLRP